MPFPMKIQPIDSLGDFQTLKEPIRTDSVKPVLKSRLKRLFDRQFPNVLKISSAEKVSVGEPQFNKDGASEFEPSSVCLAKMVQNFIEESNEKPSAAKCGRNRCNCFHGNSNDSSDDEFDVFGIDSIPYAAPGDSGEILKSLIPCESAAERNILADTAKIIEKNKFCKRKDDLKKIVTDSLSALGYDASLCKSRWDKTPSYPAGEYEYIDAIVEGERLLIDIDFRSEFEIARSTGNYRVILQSLPYIFVGKADRLQQIVSIVSEAAKQSLKKKGMHFPPWRKSEYMRAKWLSPYTRTTPSPPSLPPPSNDAIQETEIETANNNVSESDNKESLITSESECGELELIFGEKTPPSETGTVGFLEPSPTANFIEDEKRTPMVVSTWHPPALKPKSCERGAKVVTGLASLLKDKP